MKKEDEDNVGRKERKEERGKWRKGKIKKGTKKQVNKQGILIIWFDFL